MEDFHPQNERAYCPYCKREREFEFYAFQTFRGHVVYDLYTCTVCGESIALHPTRFWREYRKSIEDKIFNKEEKKEK